MSTLRQIKITPGDLAFLHKECPRCSYLKLLADLKLPFTGFPAIFSKIDSYQKKLFSDPAKIEEVFRVKVRRPAKIPTRLKGLPFQHMQMPGVEWITTCSPDDLWIYEDNTIEIIDHKTSDPTGLDTYAGQMACYRHVLENPAEPKKLEECLGIKGPFKVRGARLLCWAPGSYLHESQSPMEAYHRTEDNGFFDGKYSCGMGALHGGYLQYPIACGEEAFAEALLPLYARIQLDRTPAPSPKCPRCSFIDNLRDARTNLTPWSLTQKISEAPVDGAAPATFSQSQIVVSPAPKAPIPAVRKFMREKGR